MNRLRDLDPDEYEWRSTAARRARRAAAQARTIRALPPEQVNELGRAWLFHYDAAKARKRSDEWRIAQRAAPRRQRLTRRVVVVKVHLDTLRQR